jgi:hypothetical protein
MTTVLVLPERGGPSTITACSGFAVTQVRAAAEALHVLADGFTGMLGVCQLIGESHR